MTKQACSCWEHQLNSPTVIRKHTFHREESYCWWRWKCSCGGCGKWQGQSPNVSYHGWLRHVSKHDQKKAAK